MAFTSFCIWHALIYFYFPPVAAVVAAATAFLARETVWLILFTVSKIIAKAKLWWSFDAIEPLLFPLHQKAVAVVGWSCDDAAKNNVSGRDFVASFSL